VTTPPPSSSSSLPEAPPVDDLLRQLEPVAASLLERHLASSREWFPHQVIPYSRGRDMPPELEWEPSHADLGGVEVRPEVASALYVNLLTEDNLPYYFRDVQRMFGNDSAYGEWTRRWTAEEGRHSMAIFGYLMTTQAIDPVELERGRMVQMSSGEVPQPPDAAHGLAYLSLQELATRIAHRNTGKLIGDPVGYEVMARVAADENLHYLFYRDLATAAIEIDPSLMVEAIERVVEGFAMPGTGIPSFDRHAAAIARAGIYDLAVHHEQILVPVVLHHWKLDALSGLTAAAEAARDRIFARIERIGRVARRLTDRRAEAALS
jgi:acyl-[acyl-carrier-protein] desaturase